MKNIILNSLIIALLVFSMSADGKTITIGIDLSGSNPMVKHKNFAHSAAEYADKEISKLKNGDIVRLKTFGSRDNVSNLLSSEYVVSRRVKPRKISAVISSYINSLPSKSDAVQGSTNLLAWLDFTGDFDCSEQSRIIVFTDGLESSELIDFQSFVNGKAELPEPDNDLNGCTVTVYGLGAGMPPTYVKNVRSGWRTWFKKAGATFKAIIP